VIVLASTSAYRAELFERFGLAFTQAAPDCDETGEPGEIPADLALRLANTKARSLSSQYPDSLIIGSDQVCSVGDKILGKPGTVPIAVEQLRQMRGQMVVFHTAVCVLNASTGESNSDVDQTVATLRDLSDAEIERYIRAEMPLDCAGSFMVEKLGISLFDKIESSDPTALIGLPMIVLAKRLREFGLNLP